MIDMGFAEPHSEGRDRGGPMIRLVVAVGNPEQICFGWFPAEKSGQKNCPIELERFKSELPHSSK